jgi:multidrug resistance efflux pump
VTYINPRVENNQLVEAGTLLLELDRNGLQLFSEQRMPELRVVLIPSDRSKLGHEQHRALLQELQDVQRATCSD